MVAWKFCLIIFLIYICVYMVTNAFKFYVSAKYLELDDSDEED
jgi:hypothetical protein